MGFQDVLDQITSCVNIFSFEKIGIFAPYNIIEI